VNKDAPMDEKNSWDPKLHNEKVFNALRGALLLASRSTIQLNKEILMIGTEKLEHLLEGYLDNRYVLNLAINNKGNTFIMPAQIEHENGQLMGRKYREGEIVRERKKPFNLTPLRFENGIPISKFLIDLDGNISMSKDQKKLFLCIRAAGVTEAMKTDDFIKFRWDIEKNSLELNIIIPKPSPPQEIAPDGDREIITNHVIDRMVGQCKFWFPNEHRPVIPKMQKNLKTFSSKMERFGSL